MFTFITPSCDDNVFLPVPRYVNTAACISRISYIDGDKGILRYRGYPIEELAERSTYTEVILSRDILFTLHIERGKLPERAGSDQRYAGQRHLPLLYLHLCQPE